MAFKFPFTNYHELNLTWVLDQLKSLFEKSEENVTVIENYNGRLTAVETELPLVEETAQGAAQQSASAATLAQQAKSTADTAQENAIQAQGLAGTARQEAQAAQSAADAATQAAQQAQATAQNFDGRITQAENDAASALEASRSFENRVQAAITTANNAAQTATNAQGIATRADQNAALALDTLKAQRSELERIGAEQVERITEETENGKTEIENLAQSVLDSIPSDYTALSALVDKKAPVIINSASGAVASFNDGADNMKIQKLEVNIEPIQAGSGDPSPDNVRPISGWTGAEIPQRGKNLFGGAYEEFFPLHFNDDTQVTASADTRGDGNIQIAFYDSNQSRIDYWGLSTKGARDTKTFTYPATAYYVKFMRAESTNYQIELGPTATDYHPYTGNQISVTFPSKAGTVYGGTLDVVTGKLKVDRAIVVLNGAENWYFSRNRYRFGYNFANIARAISITDATVCICDIYKSLGPGDTYSGIQGISGNDLTSTIYISDRRYSTVDEFKAALAAQNATVAYKLATPIEYQLTPQEVKTLLGTNNIWANTGPVSVDYPADTKLYIDGKLAELQATILENI